MNTSLKIFITALLIPLCFSVISSLILHGKYQRSTKAVDKVDDEEGIFSAQEIYDANFDHITIPEVHTVKLQGRRGIISIVLDNRNYIQIGRVHRNLPVHHEVKEGVLYVNTKTVERNHILRIRGLVLHLPEKVEIEADSLSLNVISQSENTEVKFRGSKNKIHFIHSLAPNYRNPSLQDQKHYSSFHTLHLDLAQSSASFPQAFSIDTLGGIITDGHLDMVGVRVDVFELEIDSSSIVSLNGDLMNKLQANLFAADQ